MPAICQVFEQQESIGRTGAGRRPATEAHGRAGIARLAFLARGQDEAQRRSRTAWPPCEQTKARRGALGQAVARRAGSGTHGRANARRPVLGVLVCRRNPKKLPADAPAAGGPSAGTPPAEAPRVEAPFAEADFIRRLQEAGGRIGLEVIAFDPLMADAASRTIHGWRWDAGEGAWRGAARPLPALLYDRAWPEGDAERRRFRAALRRLLDGDDPPRLLNAPLPGKTAVHAALSRHPAIRRHLPPTVPYTGMDSLRGRLDEWDGAVFLKPDGGWQGRGILALRRKSGGLLELAGRTTRNVPFRLAGREEVILALVHRRMGARSYLMQPYLELVTPGGAPFDLRLLVQKNTIGRWTLTGAAVRLGRPDGVTANLHGGGTPLSPEDALARWFGEDAARELMSKARRLAAVIVRQLESSFGRFAELGLDFGIDRSGALWFLEANGKPGRTAARRAGRRADALSHLRPLMYARSILLRHSREGHP